MHRLIGDWLDGMLGVGAQVGLGLVRWYVKGGCTGWSGMLGVGAQVGL